MQRGQGTLILGTPRDACGQGTPILRMGYLDFGDAWRSNANNSDAINVDNLAKMA